MVEGKGYVDFESTGDFYDPNYGYVSLAIPTTLRIYDDSEYPSQGVLTVTGNTGTAGGSTKAQLTVLSSTTYTVNADTDGDGIYDWDSPILYWSDL